MDTTFIKQLFDKAILAHSKLQAARRASAAFEETTEPPTKPSQCTLDEWQVYADAQKAFETAAYALKDAEGVAKKEFNTVEQEIISNVPNGVWFQHDFDGDGQTYGIGISYTNWGGYHHNLQVGLWQDEMPSLDHRHTGAPKCPYCGGSRIVEYESCDGQKLHCDSCQNTFFPYQAK